MGCLYCKIVTSFIFRVTGVPANPTKLYFVLFTQSKKRRPKIRVYGSILPISHPSVRPPALGPTFSDCVDYIF